MNLCQNLTEFKNSIPSSLTLVVVSKTQPVESILTLYHCGHKIFGENKVQELVHKQALLPGDIEWHFVGHLQSNKVKMLIPMVSLIHSIDSAKLLQVVNEESRKINKVSDCLLQFHIATEESKFGLDPEEAKELLSSSEFSKMKNVRIRGVMGMATFTSKGDQVRKEFESLAETYRQLKKMYFSDNEYFTELSMGMSDDFKIAIQAGSTIIRVGTAIFGERAYSSN